MVETIGSTVRIMRALAVAVQFYQDVAGSAAGVEERAEWQDSDPCEHQYRAA